MNTCVVQCTLPHLSNVDVEVTQVALITQPTPPNSPQPTSACTKNDSLNATENFRNQNIDIDDSNSTCTAFARAVAMVKVQVMTRRLKEKYLGHEWIRLALQLPVDESTINNQPIRDEVVWTLLNKRLDNRTGEIATWYEWKFNKTKFTTEQVQEKVDRLRQRKIDYQKQQSIIQSKSQKDDERGASLRLIPS
ncbi:hypothetical protein PHYBLDRAFT_173500 [Phycomyces blakesleeanus NRRL 1555(-)]|uniref:Uncharacterized protein n=1 Tax=Phycomyces blakesleeanus (strain ATCC 8743b / DSM 1359 / FGSC 10004 / NBRC 33097 / NRRL 1555) TaxID=763407 RepID=A0A163D3S6_PHYB8|nr:hypothetical protein PHYBLDRAFT_173500 [Phycomyces blakesleeanus NRRL 1555(-)]OAD68510.1 hypothetical protein PHYBLDRAFT_173500 [Phycomyces blakesleeanus NRRL 1555(-)]|eukprot:XP_018286550.1 hypothetical protein PHYBLDRAFT_173500 [Phycomyces blakesleeanus NRRL 1555(-)]